MPEWFENNSFWIEMYDYMFPEEKFEKAGEEVDQILKLVNFEGGNVLDLCCGPGRHSCVLAQKDLKVTAVDRTLFLLNKGKECLARILKETTSEEMADGTILVQRHEIFDSWSRIRNEWILVKSGRANSFKFYHTIYSGQELKDRLYHVGFTRIKLFGSLDGDPYGSGSDRLIAIAWK